MQNNIHFIIFESVKILQNNFTDVFCFGQAKPHCISCLYTSIQLIKKNRMGEKISKSERDPFEMEILTRAEKIS